MRQKPVGEPAATAAWNFGRPRCRSSLKRLGPFCHCRQRYARSLRRIHASRWVSTRGVWQKPKYPRHPRRYGARSSITFGRLFPRVRRVGEWLSRRESSQESWRGSSLTSLATRSRVDSPLEGSGFEPSVPLAMVSLDPRGGKGAGGRSGSRKTPFLFTGDQRFESPFLRRRVSLSSAFHGYRRKGPAFAGSMSRDVTRERDVLATSRFALAASL